MRAFEAILFIIFLAIFFITVKDLNKKIELCAYDLNIAEFNIKELQVENRKNASLIDILCELRKQDALRLSYPLGVQK